MAFDLKSLPLEDMSYLCRTCLVFVGERNVFDKMPNGRSVKQDLEYVANIEVKENDGLPSAICTSCFDILNKFFFFKEQVEERDKFLQKKLEISKETKEIEKVEIIDEEDPVIVIEDEDDDMTVVIEEIEELDSKECITAQPDLSNVEISLDSKEHIAKVDATITSYRLDTLDMCDDNLETKNIIAPSF